MPPIPPIIPEYITVHSGPTDSKSLNVTVPFIDYIKNIISSYIYPTWPENAVIANIHALISYVLNIIYSEDYRGRGYDFDITDQMPNGNRFIRGRETYGNISRIVDDIFNAYVVKGTPNQTYLVRFCGENDDTCWGLSSWDTVALADSGYTPYQILQYFYGNDIGIIGNTQPSDTIEPYHGIPLRLGSWGDDVNKIQCHLNRISQNYPAIPKINTTSGLFNESTRSAVQSFQHIFDLPQNGIVGKATWYKIHLIHNIIKNFDEINLFLARTDAERLYKKKYKLGDSDDFIQALNLYLKFISYINEKIPRVKTEKTFTQKTHDAVMAFQRKYGLPADGIVDSNTWGKIREVYMSMVDALPVEFSAAPSQLYPGNFVTAGSDNKVVKQLQMYLYLISHHDQSIPPVEVSGIYDAKTKNAVLTFQKQTGITQSGYVGPLTWTSIVRRYNEFNCDDNNELL